MCFTRNFEIKRQGNCWTKHRVSTSYLIFPLTFQYPASLKQRRCSCRDREIRSDWVTSDIYFESWKQYHAFTVQSFFKLDLSLWTFPAFFLSGDKTVLSFAHIYSPVMLHNHLKVSHLGWRGFYGTCTGPCSCARELQERPVNISSHRCSGLAVHRWRKQTLLVH